MKFFKRKHHDHQKENNGERKDQATKDHKSTVEEQQQFDSMHQTLGSNIWLNVISLDEYNYTLNK